jgi:hypothetical protein
MTTHAVRPPVTFCVLTYGDHLPLARQALESIARFCPRPLYRLVVGANAVSEATLDYLLDLKASRAIDRLHVSPENLNKCPMMRRMLEGVDTPFTWWLDDDSYLTHPGTFQVWLEIALSAPERTVMWGQEAWFYHVDDFSYGTDVVGWVKRASWYRGKEPPSVLPREAPDRDGGQTGDDRRWWFITGGCWMIRTEVLRALDWPDPRLIKRNDDLFLCEALRQNDWDYQHVGPLGVAINTEPTRGGGEDCITMKMQIEGGLETQGIGADSADAVGHGREAPCPQEEMLSRT